MILKIREITELGFNNTGSVLFVELAYGNTS